MATAVDVGIIMGSKSDWPIMQHAAEMLERFGVVHEPRVLSAHRTPEACAQYARDAEGRGTSVLIAGAGGAAALPGVLAAFTTIPVLGVPIETKSLGGLDSLLSIVQMPAGIPVGALAIGKAGATNAALLAVSIMAGSRPDLRTALHAFRKERADAVLNAVDPRD